MQTASGLPKKSLEERKVSSEGGRSKASGGKKEGPEAAVERLDSERKVARKGVQARFQARLFSSANLTRDSRGSRFLITFFDHVFFESGRGRRQKTFRSSRHYAVLTLI